MAEKELPTPEEMQEMAEIDIRTVDTSSLVDIEQVQIQTELPQEERIADYINNHFAEDLSLEGVASQAGFSKYHFSRLFKQYTDSTFYKYLNQKRIEFAKTLLQDPGVSVTEVAFKSGFSSLSAFLRMFKLMNNCTPTEFREMYDRTKMGN